MAVPICLKTSSASIRVYIYPELSGLTITMTRKQGSRSKDQGPEQVIPNLRIVNQTGDQSGYTDICHIAIKSNLKRKLFVSSFLLRIISVRAF